MTALTPRSVQTDSLVKRLRLTIGGTVQGVGFRPFVYQAATRLNLAGWVINSAQGVVLEAEGEASTLQDLIHELRHHPPVHAIIDHIRIEGCPVQGESTFQIRESDNDISANPPSVLILPDLATCPDCQQDITDPQNRRYRYPFTNCTHCGPRFSILTTLPYDRPHTTMAAFTMCPACGAEYHDPGDRRFHAQPNACVHCGPQLDMWDTSGASLLNPQSQQGNEIITEVLKRAVEAIQGGQILALKGLGGFHLIVDACNEAAVQRLRERKHRPDKPLALMYPSVERVREDCLVSDLDAQILTSAEAPIVLLSRNENPGTAIAPAVAPHQSRLGVMLPYTPLHHLLLRNLDSPVVATSGNRSGEPVVADEGQVVEKLGDIADLFLVHNRAIATPIDDSIVQVVQNQPCILRRARGYAPFPVQHSSWAIPSDFPTPAACVLAVGGHFKSAIALANQHHIFLSHYLGDLDTVETVERFQGAIAHLQHLYQARPTAIACDAHPDYQSTRWAETLATQWNVPLIRVQHHYAHILSVMVEHGLSAPVLGIAWDGTGYGGDGTIWGGECLEITPTGFNRIAHLKPFPLPGGDAAAREPRRSALGVLMAGLGDPAFARTDLAPLQAFSTAELHTLRSMLHQQVNCPQTSSMGRLFDAIASLLNLCQFNTFEGQAAMGLEGAIAPGTHPPYPIDFLHATPAPIQIDWQPMILGILDDLGHSIPATVIAAKVHRTLVQMILHLAKDYYAPVDRLSMPCPVVLSGGCFQNQVLLAQAIVELRANGFIPYWSTMIPSNDGGLAAGQILAAWRGLNGSRLTRGINDPNVKRLLF